MSEQQIKKAASALVEFSGAMSDWTTKERQFVVNNGTVSYDLLRNAIQAELECGITMSKVYENKEIIIGSTTGKETIAKAVDVFNDDSLIGEEFKRNDISRPSGVATEAMAVEVYDIYGRKATFKDIYDRLGNIDDLCLEQGQIVDFCRNHRNRLQHICNDNFFLFKASVVGIEMLCVARVFFCTGKLGIKFNSFGNDVLQSEGSRIIVPKRR